MLKMKLLAALAIAGAAGAAQAVPTSIVFDGFCDGISMITDIGHHTVTATHDYSACEGYTDTAMIGPHILDQSIVADDASYPEFGLHFQYTVTKAGTWTLLSPELGIVNSGTWTDTSAANRVLGLKPSFQR